ncbi:hypothetical protein CHLRE_03g161081v5 [Chlamydomonas reinhardtii]|uniref:Uncharacterized protein n=1 Tax=Chlamydomonas reinhardtii TaxID=3055 RepID=A8J7C0_CHLRE|nr:uncharacterized protein CHLRE_03g161081v5 [Chlamydomonas reinhardtii]PNW84852.1 hypothetical protein CHLRE_03g161081v5 [Chlamydomonas reinhardtii]|eukprot:XP_001697490.1 predicted protein [Chlamydomonas reinhardtii]
MSDTQVRDGTSGAPDRRPYAGAWAPLRFARQARPPARPEPRVQLRGYHVGHARGLRHLGLPRACEHHSRQGWEPEAGRSHQDFDRGKDL